MYNIGICDDGVSFCSNLESMILSYCQKKDIKVDIKVWYSGESLCDYLRQENHLDILFLDIELFKMTGVEVGNYIRDILGDRGMHIVYISGKASYAQQLFKIQPIDFLVKPILQNQVNETLSLVFKILRSSMPKFEFQKGKNYYYISFKDIMYFCSEGRKINIITLNEVQEFYGKLKDVAKKVPSEFITIHQSYLVNKNFISKYTYETIELVNGTILAISKVNRKKVRESLLKNW